MKNNKLSKIEIILGYMVIIKEYFKGRKSKTMEKKRIINGEVVTIIDVEYKQVA